jgi:hypothetical protein
MESGEGGRRCRIASTDPIPVAAVIAASATTPSGIETKGVRSNRATIAKRSAPPTTGTAKSRPVKGETMTTQTTLQNTASTRRRMLTKPRLPITPIIPINGLPLVRVAAAT